MRRAQAVGLVSAHPRLLLTVARRPHRFLGKREDETPPDFHAMHVRLCLRRSQRSYRARYARREPSLDEMLTGELSMFPCGRKSLMYMLVRRFRPRRVVETGVWFGFTSAQILQALVDNGDDGVLYSMEPGFAIPAELTSRWKLTYGRSADVLPQLLDEIGPIDMFFHDSEHTYENMMFEYRAAWPRLTPGGVLVSDDVDLTRVFEDFCAEIGVKAHVHSAYGIAIKGVAEA